MGDKKKVIHIDNLPSTFKGKYRNNRFVQTGNPPIGLPFNKVANLTGLLRLGSEFISSPTNTLYNPDGNKSIIIDKAKDVIDWYNKPGPSFPYNLMKQEVYQTDDGTIGRKTFANGGKTNKIPNVVDGGIAQPLGNNFFYMNGRKHSQGGIGIGPSDKTGIEVEDGEVVETNGNELKVYSAQPIINGVSPAKLVMGGANPSKVFKAQEDFKDKYGINDDGTMMAQYGKKQHIAKSDNTRVTPIMESPRDNSIKQGDFIYYPETYKIVNNTLEKVPARKEVDMTPLEQVNPEFDILTGIRSIVNIPKGFFNTKAVNDVQGNYYRQGIGIINDAKKSGIVKVNSNAAKGKNINIGDKTITLRKTFDVPFWSKNYRWYGNNNYEVIVSKGDNGLTWQPISKSGRFRTADQEHVRRTPLYNGQTNNTPAKLFEYYRKYPIIGYGNVTNGEAFMPITGLNTIYNVANKKKFGGKNMIVSISGNVKNGLIHSPSSTEGRTDKLRVGGKRINRDGRTWEYNEEFGAYVPITSRSISRTSAYSIDRSARGETVTGSEYTFKNGRWRKNDKIDNNTTVRDIDNGNRRPQYYAERELPLFNDGAGITSGLVRAGWSHGNNNKKYNVDNINIPNVPNVNITKSKGQTPRRGQSKKNQSVQSTQVNIPPTAVYNRNLPKVEADIPTTLPVSTRNPIKESINSDGKGQGKFKNITTADWIGLGSNIAGSLASYFSSRSALNKMKSPSQPMLISANKLKTKYNINPQLDRIREDKFASYRDIDSNTASSRVSLARKQRVRNTAGQAVNELYGNKENIETNLINQDRRNQQSVRQFNAQQYNQYLDRKTAFDNGIREAKLTNINNLFTGINAGIQNMITRYENRKALNNTIGAMRASAPNVDDRIMRDAGVDYDEFIIRKRRKLGGKQSCR